MVQLDYRDARPIYTQICDGFCQQIRAGILLPGERLPSVRELATQLTINPNTIQRAYRELESQGWVESVPGKGCFVAHVPETAPAELAEFDSLVKKLRSEGMTTEDLIRRLLEGGETHA